MATRRSVRLIGSQALNGSVPDATTSPVQPAGVQSKKRKVSPKSQKDQDGFTIPSTPKRKRVAARLVTDASSTPTPLEAKAMAVPYSSGDIDDMTPPRRTRLANPLFTNAPLISPETSRLVAHSACDQVSPSKLSAPGNSTTESILDKALAHLVAVEPKLKAFITQHTCHVFTAEGLSEQIDPFRSLVSGIISQQVSGAAAKSIKEKFILLFGDADSVVRPAFPTPAQVVEKDIPTLRTAGLSQRKAEYIHGLAEKFHSGELSTDMLLKAEYEELLERLIAVRGLGKWSVEMFAMFGLKRMDVFSTGDLGVQRGMAALAGKDVSKLKAKGGGKWKYMSEKDMLEMAEKFRPYRSVFMWYSWRLADVDTSALKTEESSNTDL